MTRKIAGTDYTAKLVYRAYDNSYRQFRILDADGTHIGSVTSHKGRALGVGYHEGLGSWTSRSRSFRNLNEAAAYFARKAGAQPE